MATKISALGAGQPIDAGDCTYTKVTVDNLVVNGNTISSTTGDVNIVPVAGSKILLDGAVSVDAGVVAGITSFTVNNLLTSGNTISSTSGNINITPVSGSNITFDGAVTLDAGVVAGMTSCTSTTFIGALTGNVTGNASGTAATVTTAAQPAITSLGTLTILDVDNININGNTITATTGAVNITPASGSAIVLDGAVNIDAGVVTGVTTLNGVTISSTSGTLTITNSKTLSVSNTLTFTGTDSSTVACGAGGTVAYLGTAQSFSKAQSNTPVSVTSTGASIATDASLSNVFTHTLTENTTLANPTNLVTGTFYTWIFTQHASAAKTLALGNLFVPMGTAFTITTTTSAKAVFSGVYDGTSILYTYAQA